MVKPSQPGSSATEEEPSFPRGGASNITPLKRRQIRAEAQADAEKDFFAGVSAGEPASSKRRKKGGKAAPAQVQICTFTAGLFQLQDVYTPESCNVLSISRRTTCRQCRASKVPF